VLHGKLGNWGADALIACNRTASPDLPILTATVQHLASPSNPSRDMLPDNDTVMKSLWIAVALVTPFAQGQDL
jgi:hypothetical protein